MCFEDGFARTTTGEGEGQQTPKSTTKAQTIMAKEKLPPLKTQKRMIPNASTCHELFKRRSVGQNLGLHTTTEPPRQGLLHPAARGVHCVAGVESTAFEVEPWKATTGSSFKRPLRRTCFDVGGPEAVDEV